jgi:hypothetical protein
MPQFLRPIAAALGLACLAVSIAILSASGALAQAKQAPPKQAAPVPAKQPAPAPAAEAPIKQMPLTEKQIEGALAAVKEMDPITEKLPEGAKPDPKIIAQLDGVARKHGFASYDDYNAVVDNVSIVMAGFDSATRKYVGPEAVIKAQIATVQVDKKMPAKDKKEVLADLNAALKSPAPGIENKGNIDLVAKYYDQLAEALGEEN